MIIVRFATSSAMSTDKMMSDVVRRLPSETRPSTLFECNMPVVAISRSTPVPSSPHRNRKPTAMKLASSEDPPWLTNGKVRPVRGMSRVTPPTMMKACRTMVVVRPTATIELKSLFARAAVRYPRIAKLR